MCTKEKLMNKSSNGLSLLATALLAVTGTSYALQPLQTSTITFDPMGTGGDNGVEIAGFDWGVNSLLTVDSVPLQDGEIRTFQSYFHDALESYIDASGNTRGLPGNTIDYEITHMGGLKYVAEVSGTDVIVKTI